MIHFDWSVNFGQLITALSIISGFLVFVRKFQAMETKVDLMYGWFRKNIVHGNGSEED